MGCSGGGSRGSGKKSASKKSSSKKPKVVGNARRVRVRVP